MNPSAAWVINIFKCYWESQTLISSFIRNQNTVYELNYARHSLYKHWHIWFDMIGNLWLCDPPEAIVAFMKFFSESQM